MHAHARFRLPDGQQGTLSPGDLIGRTWSAAIRVDDPHISEAHAMLSLRGEALVLLALRRRLYVDGKGVDTVILRPGTRVKLAPHVELVVEEVQLPDAVLGLEGEGLAAQVLSGTCSLVTAPLPRLVQGIAADAGAVLWATDDRWRFRLLGEAGRELVEGQAFEVGGRTFRAVPMALSQAGATPTRLDLSGPLRIVARFDTVHLHRGAGSPLVLTGQIARVLSELVATGCPLSWAELAAPLWPQIEDRDALRRRWDGLLVRLRERLRDGGVRTDLVQSTRIGLVELVLQEGDRVEDQT